MNMRERGEATRQAQALLDHLVGDPRVGQRALGKGRDLFNRVHNLADRTSVHDALAQMQTLASRHQD